jgi:hypothetical protein
MFQPKFDTSVQPQPPPQNQINNNPPSINNNPAVDNNINNKQPS